MQDLRLLSCDAGLPPVLWTYRRSVRGAPHQELLDFRPLLTSPHLCFEAEQPQGTQSLTGLSGEALPHL